MGERGPLSAVVGGPATIPEGRGRRNPAAGDASCIGGSLSGVLAAVEVDELLLGPDEFCLGCCCLSGPSQREFVGAECEYSCSATAVSAFHSAFALGMSCGDLGGWIDANSELNDGSLTAWGAAVVLLAGIGLWSEAMTAALEPAAEAVIIKGRREWTAAAGADEAGGVIPSW